MHNPVATVLTTIFETPAQAQAKLNISSDEYDRMTADTAQPFPIKMWILRQLMDDYNINPMYIFGINNKMFMNPIPQVSK